jgi:hypothetical protein
MKSVGVECCHCEPKEHQELPAEHQNSGRKVGFSLTNLSGYAVLLTPWLWTSSLKNCEKINFCCFEPSVCVTLLWQLCGTDRIDLGFYIEEKKSFRELLEILGISREYFYYITSQCNNIELVWQEGQNNYPHPSCTHTSHVTLPFFSQESAFLPLEFGLSLSFALANGITHDTGQLPGLP